MRFFLRGLLAFFMLFPALAARAANMADTDLPGGDYRNFELISPVPSFCANVCAKDSRCRAWTFSWPGKRGKRARCFLKEKVGEKRADTCCVSGIKGGGATATAGPGAGGGEVPSGGMGAGSGGGPLAGGEGSAGGQGGQEDAASGGGERPSAGGEGGREATPSQDDAAAQAAQAEAEAEARAAAARAEKRAFCEAYAEAALAAKARNEALGCGFSGGRWSASRAGYFNWCMKNPRRRAEANTAVRRRMIERCRERITRGEPPRGQATAGTDLESCRDYASISVQQARNAQQLGCRFAGGRWSLSPGRHFEWCRTASLTARRAELAARRAALARCRRAGGWRHDDAIVDIPPRPGTGLAPYLYQWVKVRGPGPRWTTRWRPSRSGKCPLVSGCDCGGGSTCGVYRPGEAVLYWPQGCGGPAWVVMCRVRRR